MNNAFFEKTIENVRKDRDVKIIITEAISNYLGSEPNYHITKFFSENLSAVEMRKTQILMNKPVYLGLSILELRKVVMCEFWHDYLKPKFDGKAKLCCMDKNSFIVYIKINNIYKDIETKFDTSNYE